MLPTADVDATKGLVEQFRKANPNVQVELVGRRWDPLTGIDASGADVLLTSQFALDELRRRGALVSLDALMAGDKDLNPTDFLPNALKMFVDSGKTWALPAGLDPQVVYFNKDYFDKRGVPYPDANWTRDDFLQKVLKLRDPATGTFGYAIASDFIDPILFVYQHGGRLFDDLQNPTRTTFTDPKTIEAVEWYAKLLQQEGAVLTPQVAQSLGTGNLQNALRAGKSAMWIGPLSCARRPARPRAVADQMGHGAAAARCRGRHHGDCDGLRDHDPVQEIAGLLAVCLVPQQTSARQFRSRAQIAGEVRSGPGCRGRQDRAGIRRQLADDPGRRSRPAIKGHRCLHRGSRRGRQRQSLGSRGDGGGSTGLAIAVVPGATMLPSI